MKRSVFAASLCLGALASSAFAADFSIKGSLSQTFTGSNNYFLLNAPSGPTGQSLTALNFDFLALTPTTRYGLNTNFSYYNYFGQGASDTFPRQGTPAGTTFKIDHDDKLNTYNFLASWQRSDVAQTQLEESGLVTARGTVDTYSAGGGITHQVDRTNSITWSVHGATANFTDPNQPNYVDFSTTTAWNHTLSPTTTATTSATFDWLSQNDSADSQRLFWKILTGVKSQLSNRLSVNADVGVGFVNAYQNSAVQFGPVSAFQLQPGADQSALGDVGLNYRLLKHTQVSLTASQGFVPTVLGTLQKTSSAGFVINHDINERQNLAFSSQFSHSKDLLSGISYDLFTASVVYGYRLTRELRTNISYTYRERHDFTGAPTSSTVYLSLIRDLTILP